MEAMVVRWRESGKSQREFCRGEGIKQHTLSYWACKGSFAGEAARPLLPFIEVTPQQREPADVGRIEVVLSSGHMVRVFGAVDGAKLREVVAAVAGAWR